MATLELVNTGASVGMCPPADLYTLVLVRHDGLVLKPVFDDKDKPENEARMENQIKCYFRIVGVSDPTDDELSGWIGEEVSRWFTVPANPLHELSRIGDMARAIENVKAFEVGEKLNIEDLFERPFRANIAPKKSGWPKIDGFIPARTKAAAAPKTTSRKPAPVVTDEEDGSWPEE